jgi:HNH endonuclease
MSFTVARAYFFACDFPDCPETVECIPRPSLKPGEEAVRLIRVNGWAVPGRRDTRKHFCPAHIPDGVSLKAQLAARKERETLTAETFMDHVDVTDGCWLWKERCNDDGYGTWGRRFAHRLSYELNVAPIPVDYTIDHLCFNPSCVRPDHLRAIPRRANDKRRRKFGRAACPECQRVIGGRVLPGMDAKADGKIKLVRHKEPDGIEWCGGGRAIMQAIAA